MRRRLAAARHACMLPPAACLALPGWRDRPAAMGTASSRQAKLFQRAEGYAGWLLEEESHSSLQLRVKEPELRTVLLEDGNTLTVTRWPPRQQVHPSIHAPLPGPHLLFFVSILAA